MPALQGQILKMVEEKWIFWGIKRKAHIYFGSIVVYNQETAFPVWSGYQGNFPTIFKESASIWQHFMIFLEQLAETSYWCNDNRILLRHFASQSSPLDCTIYTKTSCRARKGFKTAFVFKMQLQQLFKPGPYNRMMLKKKIDRDQSPLEGEEPPSKPSKY